MKKMPETFNVCFIVAFQTYLMPPYCSVFFSLVFQAIETALDCLKSANTEPYYRRQAWEVIKCFLVAMTSLEDNKHALYQLLAHPKYDPLICHTSLKYISVGISKGM